MSNFTGTNYTNSTGSNVRQRFRVKYSKHGKLVWDKWIECDCIFSSYIDADHRQQSQIELHSKYNIHEPRGKVIDLKKLRSLTSMHGDINKNEPKSIVILKIDGKKYRFGFDDVYDYNQWKTLLDGAYNSVWNMLDSDCLNESPTVNMLYESSTARRYRVHFADLATQEVLSLPTGGCDLIIDTDKLVLEQYQQRQYSFPRSTIRAIRLVNDTDIEFELGSRAPISGLICFRFETFADARSCYLQWHEGFTKKYISPQAENPHVQTDVPLRQLHSHPSPQSRRTLTTKTVYYNTESPESSTMIVPTNDYISFHTLV